MSRAADEQKETLKVGDRPAEGKRKDDGDAGVMNRVRKAPTEDFAR